MRLHPARLLAGALVVASGSNAIVSAQLNPFSTGVRYTAQIAFAGGRPGEAPLDLDDFRIDETGLSSRGAQRVTLRGDRGTFDLAFAAIREIEVQRHLGLVDGFVEYEARVTLSAPEGAVRTGRLRVRALHGVAAGSPWHLLPAARVDRGAGLARITITGRTQPVAAPLAPPTLPK